MDTLTMSTTTWAAGSTASFAVGVNVAPIVALTCIDNTGTRVYKFYQVQFSPAVDGSILGTDPYTPVTPPAANDMTYTSNTITLDIKSALTGAACGDQLVIALFTNKFFDANVKF